MCPRCLAYHFYEHAQNSTFIPRTEDIAGKSIQKIKARRLRTFYVYRATRPPCGYAIRLLVGSDDLHGNLNDMLFREAELLEELCRRCRSARSSPCRPSRRRGRRNGPSRSSSASTATRARTSFGRTLSLYSALCCSKRSMHGIETTRTSMPLLASSSCASMASDTSEPVPMRIPAMFAGSFASETTQAPLRGTSLLEPGSCGRFWRVSTSRRRLRRRHSESTSRQPSPLHQRDGRH